MKNFRARDGRTDLAISAAAVLIWGVVTGVISLYFASAAIVHGDELFSSYFSAGALASLNILPCVIMAVFFWLLTNRAWSGVALSGLVVLGGSLVNFYKITLRNDPLLAADVTLISEAANMTGNYTLEITKAVALTVAGFVAYTLITAFLCRGSVKKWPIRAAVLVLVIILSALLINGVYFDDDRYSAAENIEVNSWFLSRWSDRDQYVSRGFIYPFLYSAKNAVEKPPEGYNEGESRDYLASFEDDDIPEDKKVNIIAVMLEAYADFSDYGVLDFGVDPYEYFHKIQAESLSGHLVTNIFAGGTIDTERSFITGYPYMSQYRKFLPTYASYMASQGYYVAGGHPGYDWFYNRRNVAEYFGFEDYYFFEDRYGTDSAGLMMDKDFFPDLLELYEQQDGRPYFNFSVTYQNHGPYSDEILYDGENVYAENKGYSQEGYRILNNYLWGIRQTDKAMEALFEELRGREEPFVVVMFGDHLPWLGDGGYVYDEIGVDLDRSGEQGFYNYYSTPYIIWANDSAKNITGGSFSGDGGNFSPCFLMNKIFDECGWGGPAYMKAANRMTEYVDVINRSGIFRTTGGGLTTSLDGQAREEYYTFKRLEYYMKKDAPVGDR